MILVLFVLLALLGLSAVLYRKTDSEQIADDLEQMRALTARRKKA